MLKIFFNCYWRLQAFHFYISTAFLMLLSHKSLSNINKNRNASSKTNKNGREFFA